MVWKIQLLQFDVFIRSRFHDDKSGQKENKNACWGSVHNGLWIGLLSLLIDHGRSTTWQKNGHFALRAQSDSLLHPNLFLFFASLTGWFIGLSFELVVCFGAHAENGHWTLHIIRASAATCLSPCLPPRSHRCCKEHLIKRTWFGVKKLMLCLKLSWSLCREHRVTR